MQRGNITLTIAVPEETFAVLERHAQGRAQTVTDVIASVLYRHAAQMSGWPGRGGQDMEEVLLRRLFGSYPEAQEQLELPEV